MIEFKNVSKIYTGITALDHINLEITEGEFVFLVGPSGSGKTTIIKLLIKEEEPTEGNVFFYETDITKLTGAKVSQLRQEIGVVFQDFKLLPNKNLYENIAFALEVSGKKLADIEETVPYVLELVDLSHRANAFPHEISGGEKQKIAIARAVSNNPKVLIADEPTGNLDPDSSWEIINLLSKINDWGTTVIMATHGSEIVDRLGKRVIQLDHGKVMSDNISGSYPAKKTSSRPQKEPGTHKSKVKSTKEDKIQPLEKVVKKPKPRPHKEAIEEKEFEITFTTKPSTFRTKPKTRKSKTVIKNTKKRTPTKRKGKDVVDLHSLDIPSSIQEQLIKAGYTSINELQKDSLQKLKKIKNLKNDEVKKVKKALEKKEKK
ncbi:cell division ATP-binding protein FtsE [Candidatus Dojkabacteria bacterium]|nr:cell division ATP-binding protein FtsE [Candidatus Dojkabacteria bacterium]